MWCCKARQYGTPSDRARQAVFLGLVLVCYRLEYKPLGLARSHTLCVPSRWLQSWWHYVLQEYALWPSLSLLACCPGCPRIDEGLQSTLDSVTCRPVSNRLGSWVAFGTGSGWCTTSPAACKPPGHPPNSCAQAPHCVERVLMRDTCLYGSREGAWPVAFSGNAPAPTHRCRRMSSCRSHVACSVL